MTFLSPVYLWGLLSLLPLAAIYLLKVKPTRQTTNAWFLWEKVFEEKQNSALFSKMRHWLSLLLMMLVVSAIFCSLAQPRFGDVDESDLIIILDNSASMGTHEGGSSRLERAKGDAHQQVRNLHGEQRAVIASINGKLHFHTHLSHNSHELHRAIDEIQQSSLPLSGSAIESISQSLNPAKNHSTKNSVIFLTDGCFPLKDTSLTGIEIQSYFRQTANVGITNADMQPLPGIDRNARCMVELVSSAKLPIDVELEVTHATTEAIGKLIKLRLLPGKNPPVFFNIPNVNDGHWIVRILHQDALESDNTAHLYLHPLIAVPVSINAKNNYFYQRCLEAYSATGDSLAFTEELSDGQLVLCHQSIPDQAPKNLIVFAPRGESAYWGNVGSELSVGIAIKQQEDHPALRHLDCNQIDFSGAVKLDAPESAQILVAADDDTPLIYVVHKDGRNVVVVNLDPEIDDFFLSPWFPVIIYDVATFLRGTDQILASSYATGETFLPSVTDPSTVISPDGATTALKPNQAFTLDQVGVYQIETERNATEISASLYSTDDSLQVPSSQTSGATEATLQASPSYWLIIAALIILVSESLLYHRRKVG